jgi:hypothetical protein
MAQYTKELPSYTPKGVFDSVLHYFPSSGAAGNTRLLVLSL